MFTNTTVKDTPTRGTTCVALVVVVLVAVDVSGILILLIEVDVLLTCRLFIDGESTSMSITWEDDDTLDELDDDADALLLRGLFIEDIRRVYII